MPQNFSFTRKAAYQYGWDWGPRILTVGIWKQVGISCYNHIKLKNIHLEHEPITRNMKSVKNNVTASIGDLNPNYTYQMKVKFLLDGGLEDTVNLTTGSK